MSMTGLGTQDMVTSEAYSVSDDSYFRGNPFEENPSSFGAILTPEEIADRYGLRE